MRILLATAVAIAPLMAASGASAEVVISTARTTPITTSNATGSGADSIRIASGGSVNVASGAAVTLNSSHTVDLDGGGLISMAGAANGATAILASGGNLANVIVGGTISITDDIGADDTTDTDGDGDGDGPFASGSDRYGLRVQGPGAFQGDVVVERSGAIQVEGNTSAAVAIETSVTGRVNVLGGASVTGNNSFGVRTTGDVSGDVNIVGAVQARGENSQAISIEGDVGGALRIQSTVTNSGYRYNGRPDERPAGFNETSANEKAFLFLDELDADDLLQGGAAVTVAGNVARGVLLDAAPVYSAAGIEGDDDGDGVKNGDEDDDGDGVANRTDTDRNGNGLVDTDESTAAINTFGSAPAVRIGSTTEAVTLGAAGAGTNAYGFINRGSINAQGVFAGVDASGLVVGGTGQTVNVAGGVRNEGTVSALSIGGNATAIRFGAGANANEVFNSGFVTSAVSADQVTQATTLQIDAGANVPRLTNSGSILATAGGGTANTTAVRDLGGSLTSIDNSGSIRATVSPNQNGDPVTGRNVALDLAANTAGVTLLQTGRTGTGADADGDGVPDAAEPEVFGEVRLGSGSDVLDIRNGQVVGDISFGAGADRLEVSGGALVRGGVTDSDGALSINVSNGVLDARQVQTTTISSLNVGADGNLVVTVDPGNGQSGGFNVSGTATLADGAGLGVRFASLLDQPGRYTLIDANTLNVGQIDLGSVEDNSPYLYVVSAGTDVAAGQVFADIRRRTAEEAGFIASETQFYDAFYDALDTSGATTVRNAFLAQAGRDDFINLYEQLLPEHSGGPLLALSSGVDAVTRALVGRNASATPGSTSAWVQEINFYADKDKTDTYGFRSEGFGVAGGVERMTGMGAVGISGAFTSSDLEDPEAEAEEVLSANLIELGLYWRAQGQRWTTWARAAAGYATFNSERRLVGAGLNLANEADWNGFTLAAAAGASYEQSFGRLSIRPEAYVEYFSLSEEGYAETGGGDGFDLEVDDRDGHLFSATAAINLGWAMGSNSWLKPELRVGWRQNISVDPGETIARFRSGGSDFILTSDNIEGGGPIAGLRLNIGNELGMLSVSADAEMIDDYIRYMLFLRASFRF